MKRMFWKMKANCTACFRGKQIKTQFEKEMKYTDKIGIFIRNKLSSEGLFFCVAIPV